MSQVPGGAIFIHDKGYTILQHNKEDLEDLQGMVHGHGNRSQAKTNGPRQLRSHAYRVHFLQASQPTLVPDKALETYSNYFIGNDPSKWASNCRIYQAITVKEIYPGVDVRYYADNGHLKYDFIVKPGADPSRIALKYEGADKLEVKNKELVVGTSVGDIHEMYPYSYQVGEKGRKEVGARYVVKGNVVSFDMKNYDPSVPLVIDPRPVFATFAGSTSDNWGFTATYGPDGSMYGGGIVFGNGFPTSTGAFQQSFLGGTPDCTSPNPFDIGIIKLSPNGSSRIYATYIGGANGTEQPHSLVVDAQGNLVLAGRTLSSDYPTRGGTGLIGKGGGYDIIVTKLNANGTQLIGSKRIGGTGDDGVNIKACNTGPTSLHYNYGDASRSEVILDAAGNIYLASNTQSTSTTVADQFPTTAGAFKTTPGGLQDGVIIKLPPDLSSLTFSSFLGGSQDDAAYVLALNPFNNNIYVAGGTGSNNFPGVDASSHQSIFQGVADGYISIVSNNGATLLKSSYFGTSLYDQVFGIQFDRKGFPYIMGQTEGDWPKTAPWWQPGGKQFIAKVKPDLSGYVYSTVFGSNSSVPNISPVAFLVDRCENVYVSGWGGKLGSLEYNTAGTSELTTVNPLQPNTDGKDFYFFVLKRNGTGQLYGDFFGQNGGTADHVDGGTSRFDVNGVIYQAICANCHNPGIEYPTSFGSWSPTNPSGACNLAMVKIDLDLAGTASGVQSSINGSTGDTSGCMPLRVFFRDTVLNAKSYEWNFGDGSPQITTSTPDTSHLYNAVGTYKVMLVAIDSNSCNIRDTSYLTIRVGDLIATLGFNAVKLDPCQEFKYRFDNTSTAPAVRPFGAQSFKWDFGDGSPRVVAGTGPVFHSYASPGTYKVRLVLNDTVYCNYPDSVEKNVRVSELVKALFDVPPKACSPFTFSIDNLSEGGSSFTWDFGDGNSSTDESPSHTYLNPGVYTITLTAIDSATCNIIDTAQRTITVFAKPVANFSVTPQPPSVNTPITFTNQSSPDATTFKWVFGDGDSMMTKSRLPIQHEYDATKTYIACLTAYNDFGCADDTCQEVRVLVEAAVDVPNAFTPLNGSNNIVYVRGYGIGKMRFVIWNRWGQKVFETDNKRTGWDGKFKGVVQPMDVYAYTLEVEFTDGTKATKKGDITLIR